MKKRRTVMGTEVCVLFADVREARKFAEEASQLRGVQHVGLVRPVVRRYPQDGKVTVEVEDFNKSK
jgi:class 3 adenylate cyclase